MPNGADDKKPDDKKSEYQHLFQLAEQAERNKEYKKALWLYMQAAEGGSPEAYYNMGYISHIFLEDSTHGNYDNAAKYYKKAIELSGGENDTAAKAFAMLGRLYLTGYGVPKDYEIAVDCFRSSMELGNTMGIFFLGTTYEGDKDSHNFIINTSKALICYKAAFEEKDGAEKLAIGKMKQFLDKSQCKENVFILYHIVLCLKDPEAFQMLSGKEKRQLQDFENALTKLVKSQEKSVELLHLLEDKPEDLPKVQILLPKLYQEVVTPAVQAKYQAISETLGQMGIMRGVLGIISEYESPLNIKSLQQQLNAITERTEGTVEQKNLHEEPKQEVKKEPLKAKSSWLPSFFRKKPKPKEEAKKEVTNVETSKPKPPGGIF